MGEVYAVRMLHRLKRAASLMRPRALARMVTRLDTLDTQSHQLTKELHRQRRDLKQHEAARTDDARAAAARQEAAMQRLAELASSVAGMTTAIESLHGELKLVRRRAEQTAAVMEGNIADERRLASLPKVLRADRIGAHIRAAVAAAELQLDPCPHLVVENVLPQDCYDTLVAAIPPRVLFEDRPVNKQQLRLPPTVAPELSRRVWRFVAEDIVKGALGDCVLERLREPLTEYLHRFWPGHQLDDPEVPLGASDGRIILRRAGYVIPPHRDPRWGLITIILYLARPGDPSTWGTQFYRVREDVDATSAVPYWIDAGRCEQVRDVPFVPNRAVVFVNSDGAHGASIPADAPADFERYICQWRIGPDALGMRALMGRLPPAARTAWEGKEGY